MRTKWCHLNGTHPPHEWGLQENPIHCPGVPQAEDVKEEENDG